MSKEDFYQFEEQFHAQDRKLFRKERKMAASKDRSKFKKSDQDQLKKRSGQQISPAPNADLLRGRVLAITPEGTEVDCNGTHYICSLKGTLKQDKNRLKNLVAVGDFVQIEKSSPNVGCIVLVEERRSILSRADNLSRNKEQLIAVNIDLVLITSSVLYPPLKPFLVDRYIIAAQKGNMAPLIIVNKIDLLENPPEGYDPVIVEAEKILYEEFLKTYKNLNITIFPVSATNNEGIEALKKALHGKTAVFSGQSGVGKSSLINLIADTNLSIGSVVEKTRKGSHTTSTAHLIPIAGGGFCIDTPGIKSFGLWDLEKEQIEEYFPEISSAGEHCKFPDCSHMNEPECAVQKAVEEERISLLRFASYCALMTSVAEKHRNR